MAAVPPLRGYAALAGARLRAMLQYRAAALAALTTQLFWGLLRLMILDGFYRSAPQASDFGTEHLASYVWLGQALFALFPHAVDPVVAERVRGGAVAHELLRPLDLYAHWAVSVTGWRVGMTVLRAVPMVLIAAVALPLLGVREWSLGAPAGAAAALGFAASVTLGLLTGTAITLVGQAMLLRTLSAAGWNALLPAVAWFCSGALVPLPYLADWAQAALALLPFAGLMDTPFRIYTGHLAGAAAALALLTQAAWVVALVAVGRLLLARGVRRVVIQGG